MKTDSQTPPQASVSAPILLLLAYSLYKAVMLNSYVTAFGLIRQPLGYIASIPFMISASAGILGAAAFVLATGLKGSKERVVPFRIPLAVLIAGYGAAPFLPSQSTAALVGLGIAWGAATALLTCSFANLFAREESSTLLILQLAFGSFFSGALILAMANTS